MRVITQFKCSSALKFDGYRPAHGKRFMHITGLKGHRNAHDGLLYFGCYNQGDYKKILRHKGLKVIYWAGSDITEAKKKKWVFDDKTRHVTGTGRSADELRSIGYKVLVRPVCEIDPNKFRVYPKGDSVYVYLPWKRAQFYGLNMVKKVAAKLPKVNFILARYGPKKKPFNNCEVHCLVNFEELLELYKRSGCSIRPTRHDGFPQGNIELGLMSRLTGYPHDDQWGVKCLTVSDYVKFIRKELEDKRLHNDFRQKILKNVNNFDFLGEGLQW